MSGTKSISFARSWALRKLFRRMAKTAREALE
jgi:hypothetical protein